jgi:hypothetical protein
VDKRKKEKICINVFLDFVHLSVFQKILKNTTFRQLDLFPSSDERMRDVYSVESVQRFGLAHSDGAGFLWFAELEPFSLITLCRCNYIFIDSQQNMESQHRF